MTGNYETLNIRSDGRLVRLELARPERLNAVAMTGAREMLDAVRRIAADEDVRMVAITGSGRAFCTGIDLKDLAAGLIEQSYFDLWDSALRVIETMDKLAVCLMHGYAVGGGLQLALACDIRVCTPSAKLGLPAIKEGLIPGLGTFRLARYVGLGRAKSLIIRGSMIDGAEAERIGLVDHLVGEDTAFEEFEGWLAEYTATNSVGCRAAKQMLLDCFDLGWEAFFRKYLVLQERAVAAPDFAEARDAYLAGRKPQWG
ncbi:MAG: enoyl-CoA hydratase/isomerase family protein [Thiotrichales bacterium]|nr:enoyl-CoA hydratase/isomerase family protein [Thiotrichales bacterium]